MAAEAPNTAGSQRGRAGGGSRLLSAAALAAVLGVLGLLVYYFATRPESDWVLVIAMALCIVAVAFRLVRVARPGRSK